jgi:hypothetical protein
MSLPPNYELQRLQRLHEQAHNTLVAAQKQTTEQQLSIAKDESGYFEKVAGFCGGAIVLVVSFLGGHKEVLMHWHMLIPISISVLTGGMIAATLRNNIYRRWAHRAYERSSLQAQRDEQEARGNCLSVTPNAVSMQTGELLDQSDVANIKKSTAGVDIVLKEWEAKDTFLLNSWIRSGRLAEALAVTGIICLAALAIRNV